MRRISHPVAGAGRCRDGFTLVEIMIVVAIIALLAVIALPAFMKNIEESRISRTRADLRAIGGALEMLAMDTALWPGGFPADKVTTLGANEFEDLSLGIVGLLSDDGTFGPRWSGPYMDSIPKDPWNNNYFFDIDYRINGADHAVVGSYGPNGTGLNQYDNDDIYDILAP